MSIKTLSLGALLAAGLAAPALGGERCYIPYAEFEQIAPHVDLDVCPEGITVSEDEFCRLGLEDETVTIYRFEIGLTEDCLVAMERYEWADFVERFGPHYQSPYN